MARMDDLVAFAQRHALKIGTIRDLIAYRLRKDHLLERRASARFDSRWGGTWQVTTFYNKATKSETVVLIKGTIDPAGTTLVRMHSVSPFADILGETSERGSLLARSMEIIGAHGSGVIVLLNPGGASGGLTKVIEARNEGLKDGDPGMEELRDYGFGAQILAALNVHDMELLTNSRHTLVALDGYGLSIVGERPVPTGEA